MRATYSTIFVGVAMMMGTLFAMPTQLRIQLPLENLVMSEEGPHCLVEGFEPVPLDNLHFDERGYYTTHRLSYACPFCCQQLKAGCGTCLGCGFDQDNGGLEEVVEVDYSIYAELYPLLSGSLGMEAVAWKGYVEGDVTADTKGNASATVKGGVRSDDNKTKVEVEGSGQRDSSGNTSGQATVRGSHEF